MKYVTDDGKEFDNLEEAEAHETALSAPARTIIFSGHSDDIVMVTGYSSEHPYRQEEFSIGPFTLKNTDGTGVTITPIYNGCWSFAIGLLDEDKILPQWINTARYLADGYVCELIIDVPSGTWFSGKPTV